jgi:5'-AMP-activated protein kinase regulatory beta subunit
MDEDDVNLYMKPGVFTIKSKLDNFGPSYEGLHSDDSLSLSYLEEEIEDDGYISNNSSSLSSYASNTESIKKKNISSKKSSKANMKLVPYTFTWDEGGKEVKLTGTFGKWTKFFDMKYNEEEKRFKIILRLPRGKHEYKFVVDGVWKFSHKQQTIRDNKNNTNNVIDLTDYAQQNPPQTTPQITKNKIPEKKEKEKKMVKKKKIIRKKKDRGYGLVYPNKDMLNSEAPMVQQDYMETFIIDAHTNQNIIGRSKYFNYKTSEPYTEEKSYKSLMIGPHVNLNHSLKCIGRRNLLEMGINFRFRDKNCTLVYYSYPPKEE